jgi:2,4-dienoyl-CoA reductase-like NADH-dependent reductase (Old Yellow Enzyme family)
MASREKSIVFSSGRIGKLELKNRLVRSATYENAGSGTGEVTDTLLNMYRDFVLGGIGLIVTGIMPVYSKTVASRQIRIDADDYITGLQRIPKVVRDTAGDCKIMTQLHHPGRQVPDPENMAQFLKYLPPAFIKVFQEAQQTQETAEEHPHIVEPTAPSAVFDETFQRTPRALTLEEIDEIIEAYAEGIRRSQEAGFDGVQLHAAHGWLLSSFLSPHTNHREDEFGGSTENRTRIVKEIYTRGRKKVDADFPILIKMNTTDFFPDGTDIEEALRVGEIVSNIGFSAIESSGGMWETVTRSQEELGWIPVILPESRTKINTKDQEAYFLPGAKALKSRIDTPIMLVGGLKSIDRIEEILDEGSADFVSLSRPLIRQPNLPNLWLTGEGPDKAECISCNACLPMGPDPTRCKAKKQYPIE